MTIKLTPRVKSTSDAAPLSNAQKAAKLLALRAHEAATRRDTRDSARQRRKAQAAAAL